MASAEWYFSRNNQQEGPVAFEALTEMARNGTLLPSHLVWTAGMNEWQQAGRVPGIFPAAPAPAAYAPPPPQGYSQPGYAAPGYAAQAPQQYPPPAYAGQGYPPQPYGQPGYPGQPLGYGPHIHYGGFWARFVAYFIDGLILWVVGRFITGIIGLSHTLYTPTPATGDPFESLRRIVNGPEFHLLALAGMLQWIVAWLYFALFDSSAMQGTPGKKVFGLKITNLSGQRIGFGRATGRYFAKILSVLLFCIGFLMIAFTERKRGLHDMIAGTLVQYES